MRLHPIDQVQSVTIRQAHIGQAQIERLGSEQRFRACNVGCGPGIDIHAAERQR